MGIRYRKVYRLNGKQAVWLVAAIFLMLGLIFSSIGIGIGVHDAKKQERCVSESTGEIVSLSPISVEYTVQGMRILGSTGVTQNPPPYQRGERVQVLYNPQDPDEFYIYGFSGMKIFVWVFGGIGGVMVLVGIVIFGIALVQWKKAKQEEQNKDWF